MNVPQLTYHIVRTASLWVLGCLLLLTLTTSLHGQGVASTADTVIPARPNPPRLVNDFVGILNPADRAQLEQKLRAYNDSTSTQIAIVIVRTTEPYPIGDFAFQVGRKWGVGQQGKNNGLVIAWATQTRKVFIAPGYGLEGAIPDAIAKRIITNVIAPNFKQEQYYQGLDQATTEIIQRARGEYDADPSAEGGGGSWIVFAILAIILLAIVWGRRNGGGGTRYRGGGGFGPIFFPTSTFSGWGSSGGGGWGGGGGGSDFGGFGGGSFGGGGAGGDY